MSLKERVRNWLQVPSAAPAPTPAPPAPRSSGGPAGPVTGRRLRISQDNPQTSILSGLTQLAPFDPENDWRALTLDSLTFDKVKPPKLLQLLCDLSPEISLALWNLLRLGNPGWEADAFTVASEGGDGGDVVDKPAQAALNAFLAVLKERHGSTDVILNRLFMSAFLRGTFVAELVLDRAGRTPLDIAVPDAQWIYFRAQADPELGVVWEPFQYQRGRQVSLARPTFRYVPVDPFMGRPEGRPLAMPALFSALFLLGLLHDLRRVIAQQGYPRLDITIDLEQLLKTIPLADQGDPEAVRKWLDDAILTVQTAYRTLQPDDAYVHTSVENVGNPVGAIDSSSLGATGSLIEGLERFLMRALKSSPLLMGLSGSSNEAQSNRQWELTAAGVKSLQHLCEGLLEHLLTLALRAQGLAARVQFRFAELRAAELLRDAQVLHLDLQNAALAYALGYVDMDTAAKMGAGVDKADQSEPRVPTAGLGGGGGGASSPSTAQADPGSQRGVELDLHVEGNAEAFKKAQQQLYDDFKKARNGR